MFNSVQIVGFLGKDPERREARGNGAAFTVLSVATQRSWKNAEEEWTSKVDWHRVVAWNALGERVAETVHKGDLVLVAGRLVSSRYDREYGKGKKAATVKHTVWQIRATSIRRLNRDQKEPEALASGSGEDGPGAVIESIPMGRYLKDDHVKCEAADDRSGDSEWMWLLVENSDDERGIVFGRLDSQPVVATDMKLGQELAISYLNIREHRRES